MDAHRTPSRVLTAALGKVLGEGGRDRDDGKEAT
jgi:hypothetical protein